jgi:tetratricopeptide (TPR) repeat protein
MHSYWFRLSRSAGLLFILGILLAAPAPAQSSPDTTEPSLQEAIAKVDSLRQTGDFQAALDRLQTLRDEHPERVAVLWRLVYTWADLRQATDDDRPSYYENALEVAEAGLAADSSSARAHLAMAVAQGRAALNAGTQERIRRSRAVKRHADRAIALDSTLASAYHTRGRWHRGVSDIGFFKRAIVKTIYGGLPDASFEQAVQDFKRAIEFNDEVFHHLELAKTYLKMDRPQAARRELKTALNMSSDGPFASKYKKEARKLLQELG